MKVTAFVVSMALTTTTFAQNCVPPPIDAVVAYPAGTLIENVGTTDLPITANEKAKRLCQQGFALIHCFWFNEAIRSFRDATREDPTSAIAWCGLNIALTQPWARSPKYAGEAEYAIKKAIANIDSATPVEQALIRAYRLRSFGKDDRDTDFENSMKRVLKDHPAIDEPRLLWAGLRCQLCMYNGYQTNGDLFGDLEAVAGLVEPVLKRDPNSLGALHYAIHAYEPVNPQKAIGYARTLARKTNSSPHMVHMPGHIFYRLGLYDDGFAAFSKSKEADEAYAKKLGVSPYDAHWQYGHNLAFLAFNLMEMGRIKDVLKLGFGQEEALIRQAKWADVVALPGREAETFGRPTIYAAYQGMAAMNRADRSAARKMVDKLERHLAALEAKNDRNLWTQTRILKTATLELKGRLLASEGKVDDAIVALKEAIRQFSRIEYAEPPMYARPPHETLGYILIDAGRTKDAVEAFKAGLAPKPNSGWMLYGIALAYEKGGQKDEAKRAYQAFLKQWTTADPDLPQVIRARKYLKDNP